MKAIVSGGAGFIGSHLVELLLDEGHIVTVLDNFSTGRIENLESLKNKENLNVVKADITEIQSIAPYFSGKDWVFHLAALADIVPSIEEPVRYHKSNVDGTVNVLECARSNGIKRFVYAASSSCYGADPDVPTYEECALSPQYPYALTKYAGEQYVMHWGKVYGLEVVSLRLFNVYGPRARTSGAYGAVLGVFLAQKLAGKPFTIVGDGEQKRDFVFVKDVARAFKMAAESEVTGEVFNVGTGSPVSVNTLAEFLGGEKVYIPKRPGEPDSTHAETSKIFSAFGWKALVPFERGVSLCLERIDHWKGAPVWTPVSIEESTRAWFKYLSEKKG
ncbi:MAG: SDR family oxidoreductase [Candidatus Omnitrophota bacterium]